MQPLSWSLQLEESYEMSSRNKRMIERIAEAPANALDNTVTQTEKYANQLHSQQTINKTREYWHMMGPGLTTGASDDDPSGIATYSQAGAKYGFNFLWLAAFTFPLMAVVQEMCARIGLVTGRGLAGNIRLHFPRKVLYACTILLFAANTFNIGADLGAMAKAVQLLAPRLNFGLLVGGFAAVSLGLQIFTPYARYARYLKWLALILLSYVVSAILAHLNWSEVLKKGVTPNLQFNKDQLLLVAAILGTTISPYLFFWQTSQEVEEQILDGKTTMQSRKGCDPPTIRNMRVDVWTGMLLSNVVMFFIIAACGAILNAKGITDIKTTSDAAEALRPFAGNASYYLFALGIIGTGLLAIPVLAGSSSYAVSESLGWRQGLYRNLKQAHSFYGIIMISVLIGLGLNFVGIDPIKALIYSAVGNALAAPMVLALIVLISSNRRVMGEWVNKRYVTAIGWLVTTIMVLAGLGAIYSFF